jgi:hypothetical protein
MRDTFDRISPEEGLLESLRGFGPVLVATDAGRDRNLQYARRAAAMLAAAIDTGLVLQDRSAETWGDTPHAEQVDGVEAARGIGAEHLVAQITEAMELGVDPVSAYRSSVPTFDGFLRALSDTGAQVIVTPASLGHPKLFDRLQIPKGDLITRLADVHGTRPVVIAEPDGRIRLPADPRFVRWWAVARGGGPWPQTPPTWARRADDRVVGVRVPANEPAGSD